MFSSLHACFRIYRFVILGGLLILAGAAAWAGTSYADVATTLVRQFTADTDAVKLQGKTLAITRFENKCTDEDVDADLLLEKLYTATVKAKFCKVIERQQLDKAMKELKLHADSGLVDPAEQKKLGHFLGASYLLIGTISGDAEKLSVDARIIDTETGEALMSAEYPAADGGDHITPTPSKEDPGDHDASSMGDRHPGITLVSWSASELVVSSEALKAAQAKADVVVWVVEEKILQGADDVAETWHSELDKTIYHHAERYINSIKAEEDAYYVRVNIVKLMRDVTTIIFGKITPRIAVDTTETILHRPPVPDPAVQTRLASILLSYGFQVVDSEQAHLVLSREAVRQAIYNDNPDALKQLQDIAGELHADLLAAGESVAQQRNGQDGFDARIEFHVKEAATARLLASIDNTCSITREERSDIDLTSDLCAKLALQRGADGVALRMGSEMLKAFGQPIYRVRIWKVTDFDTASAIKDDLKSRLPGAVITMTTQNYLVQPDKKNSAYIVLEIRTKKSADAVSRALTASTSPKIRITNVECRSIVAELR